MTRRSRCAADAGAADGDDAHLLVRPVAELGAQRLAVGELGRVEPGDVAGEVEVLARSSRGSPAGRGRSASGTMSSGSPTKMARSRTRGNRATLLDHLGVVVGGQERPRARRRRASAASRRSRSSRRTRRASAPGSRAGSSRVPGLVADQEVVVLVAHDVVEHHEVGDAGSRPSAGSPGSSAGRARPTRDSMWCRLVGQRRALAGWIALAARLEHRGDRVLGEPVDLAGRGAARAARRRSRRRAGRGRGRSASETYSARLRSAARRASTPRGAAARTARRSRGSAG